MKGWETVGLTLDCKTKLILLSTHVSKTPMEISDECTLPLSTTYRKLNKLLQENHLRTSGRISDGKRYFLFTNNLRSLPFRNSQRALELMKVIMQNPGLSFREVVRISGTSHGIMSHYLPRLEENGLIFIRRKKRKMWLFARDLTSKEIDLIMQLRNKTSRAIIMRLLEGRNVTFNDLTKKVNCCPGSISMALSKLISIQIVRRKDTGINSTYSLKRPSFAARTLRRTNLP